MPILDLQRKMAEKGRIRMGEKKPGEKFPRKLDTFRLTSPDRHAIEAAASTYGGTPEQWDTDNGTQWQVITTADTINVIVLPGEMAFSQWRELWSGGGCQRRCDGVTDVISDGPCRCDPNNRECKDTTRLSVMLPDLPGVGLWRLESHGYYAATELAGALQIIGNLAPGMMVRATLSAQKRTVKRFDKNGKPQTQRFVVPVLDLADVRLTELMAPTGDGVSVQIEARTGLTPVPVAELPEGPRPSIREQLDSEPSAPARRANAAAVLPATGVPLPGEVLEAGPDAPRRSRGAAPADGANNGGSTPPEEATPSVNALSGEGAAPVQPEVVESGPGGQSEGNATPRKAPARAIPDPHAKASMHGPDPEPDPESDPEALAALREAIGLVPGLTEARVLTRARRIAQDNGWRVPAEFGRMSDEVLAAVYAEVVAKGEGNE